MGVYAPAEQPVAPTRPNMRPNPGPLPGHTHQHKAKVFMSTRKWRRLECGGFPPRADLRDAALLSAGLEQPAHAKADGHSADIPWDGKRRQAAALQRPTAVGHNRNRTMLLHVRLTRMLPGGVGRPRERSWRAKRIAKHRLREP